MCWSTTGSDNHRGSDITVGREEGAALSTMVIGMVCGRDGRFVVARTLPVTAWRWVARRVGDAGRTPESSIQALRNEGFEALDDHTGVADELGPLWPSAHSVGLARHDPLWPVGSVLWLVRSPWPAFSLRELFDQVLWPWVEYDPSDRPDEHARERMSQVVNWTQDEAVAWVSRSTGAASDVEGDP